MKRTALSAAFLALALTRLSASPATLSGTYVEARTSEIFAGACIVNGEAATTGREALLAWKIDHGQFNGVSLEGLAVVAAISGDANLSVREIGGETATTKTAVFPDIRANEVQRKALVAMAKTLSNGVIGDVIEVTPTVIQFVNGENDVRVTTKATRLAVKKELVHDASCGNKQWFSPLAAVHHAEMGTTLENAYTGASLGTKWSDPDKRSSYFGMFSYEQGS
jgi:hypothetical protein